MPDLEPITRDEKLWSGEDLEPITRREMYIKHLYDETQVIPDKPITREEMFILKAGEELHDVTIEQLTATENRTYSEEGVAYSPVIVNVPQTTLTTLDVTKNGTYTAPSGTAYNEVDVDVPLPENAYLLKEIENVEIATFTDGSPLPMPKLEVAVEPQQDLHGYDSPWVGGAGKNKLPLTVDGIKAVNTYHSWSGNSTTINNVTITIETDSVGNVIGIKFNGTASADITFNLASNIVIPNGSYVLSNDQIVNISNLWLSLTSPNIAITLNSEKERNVIVSNGSIGSAYIYATSGNTFNNVVFKPMIRLATVTDATFAPYSNICPISGWSGVNVSVCGKNWCPIASGEIKSGNLVTFSTPLPSGTYSISFNCTRSGESSDQASMIVYDSNDTAYSAKIVIPNTGSRLNIENLNCNNGISRIYFYSIAGSWGSSQNYTLEITEFQVEQGSTASDYEPYNGSTYTIDFVDGSSPLIVYGGTLDVVSGVLTVDRAYVDMGSLTWMYASNTNRFHTLDVASLIKLPGDSNIPNMICSQYLVVSYNVGNSSDSNNVVFVGTPSGRINVKDSRYTSESNFKTAVTGQQLVYELATPTTIQLTPTQVSSLMGVNNIWANCGDIIDGQYFSKGE